MFKLNNENEKKYQDLLKKYPKKDSLMLPLLWIVQYQEGWISTQAMEFIAKRLDTSMAEVYGVASFYTMFNLKPIGKYHIEVCKSISCKLNGSDNILQHLEKTLHINPGQTTKDNFFTLSKVECLGACGGAPMLSINGKYYENISTKHLDHLLKDLKEEKITINLEGIANA